MTTPKKLTTYIGWAVFAITFIVYFFSAERTGSLWDCGEFILGAYKLQVVHPPGAPLFLIVGRLFAWVADMFSTDPSNIAFGVNLMSGMFTAFAAAFVTWITITFSRLAFVGRDGEMDDEQTLVASGAGLVAGLTTAFCTSVWFSAVEGEVYAMSTFFTAMTVWAMVKWYGLPNDPTHDRWIIFALFSAGLSIGVHLLSLLTFPVLAMLYYFKKYEKYTVGGVLIAMGLGALCIPVVQKLVIVGIPALWSGLELFMVNSLGMPFHSGLYPTLLIVAATLGGGLWYAHKKENGILQRLVVGLTVVVIGFSSIGIVLIRANAEPPINMNDPSDVMRLLPYLNREQYGERPLFYGPHFDARPVTTEKTPRYGRVGDRYEIMDYKYTHVYRDEDKMLLPRIGHMDSNRPSLHRMWMGDRTRPPDMAYNLKFLFKYQIGWMYMRYFMWNFVGRQNGEQGYYPWDPKSGNWLSGVSFIDSARLYNQSELPDTIKHNQARNKYFFLPLIFGLIGLFWHFVRRPKDWVSLFMLFLFTGLGIIFYSNQPPNEPRERDYVLVGSFFTFCIWIGMSVPAIYEYVKGKWGRMSGKHIALGATALVLIAPLLMAFQNFDDHSRRHHKASRDYAVNFLESCDPDAIIFTYGDNDTYPLWYAQEVEGIRTDVRVVNLSLIAVDWYINGLRRKINDSPPIKLTISEEAYRGDTRNAVSTMNDRNRPTPLDQALRYIGEIKDDRTRSNPLPSTELFIPIDRQRALQSGLVSPEDTGKIVDRIPITMKNVTRDYSYLSKDELAVLDIIMSNLYDRAVYFSVTCREDRLMGLQDYTQLEGLGLRIIPVRTPSNRNFFIYGSGRVATDKVYDRVMNKWRWGNFDKMELFVDNSYGASLQAQKMIIWRTTQELIQQGENEKAENLTDQYFEAFPHFNFPYDARTLVHINFYAQVGAMEKAKEHLRIMATEMADWMDFFASVDPHVIEAGFQAEFDLTTDSIGRMLQLANQIGDEAFTSELQEILGPYTTENLRN